MTPARIWLRRIALGLPMMASPLSGCWLTENCHPPHHHVSFELTSVPHVDGGIDCARACQTLASAPDAGASPSWYPTSCREGTDTEGEPVLVCEYYEYLCEGRRPQALLSPTTFASGTTIGSWLAQAAHLESASVPAFSELAVELALHGAPRVLAAHAQRAALDELEHARRVACLARRYGAVPPAVRRTDSAPRSLSELALDNAIEGSVREAYGALTAFSQAQTARDPEVARAFIAIARDEARHALLSDAIHTWTTSRLHARDRRMVDDARREAIDELTRSVEHESAAELRDTLGLPHAERAVDLVRALA